MSKCTCCQGEEYQPKTTALEVVLPETTRGSSGHGLRLQPCWRSTIGLAIFLHLRTGNSTYLCGGGQAVCLKWQFPQSFQFWRDWDSDSQDSTQMAQWDPKYVFRSIKVWGMSCVVEGTYPPCESLSPQRSSLFWMPKPQDLEHWNRMQAGGTILENEVWVCVCVCVCVMQQVPVAEDTTRSLTVTVTYNWVLYWVSVIISMSRQCICMCVSVCVSLFQNPNNSVFWELSIFAVFYLASPVLQKQPTLTFLFHIKQHKLFSVWLSALASLYSTLHKREQRWIYTTEAS